MRNVVLMVGLASICLLHTQATMPVQTNFRFKKMAGMWYPIATTKAVPPERAVYTYTMQPLSNGDLVLKVDMPLGATCRRKRVVLHTIRVGEFTTADDRTTVHIVETDYDNYHVILFTKEGERDLFLYARKEEVSDEVKEKFKNCVRELSLDPEAIIYLPKASPCPSTGST
ncbi:epididymal secretory protein 4-like [Paroedura picta]|uniref:epididymal secretory protein 4-like n=1 Tax=Paroedura picta TaxID=143630 RepID=UPI00405634B9